MNLPEVIASVFVLLINSSTTAWLVYEKGLTDSVWIQFALTLIVAGNIAGWIIFCLRVCDE